MLNAEKLEDELNVFAKMDMKAMDTSVVKMWTNVFQLARVLLTLFASIFQEDMIAAAETASLEIHSNFAINNPLTWLIVNEWNVNVTHRQVVPLALFASKEYAKMSAVVLYAVKILVSIDFNNFCQF